MAPGSVGVAPVLSSLRAPTAISPDWAMPIGGAVVHVDDARLGHGSGTPTVHTWAGGG